MKLTFIPQIKQLNVVVKLNFKPNSNRIAKKKLLPNEKVRIKETANEINEIKELKEKNWKKRTERKELKEDKKF